MGVGGRVGCCCFVILAYSPARVLLLLGEAVSVGLILCGCAPHRFAGMQSSPDPPPATLALSGTLKKQSACLGVYSLVPDREANGQPVWKHSSADYWIAKTMGLWMVQLEVDVGKNDTGYLMLRDPAASFPHRSSIGWQEWDGKQWVSAPSLKCVPDQASVTDNLAQQVAVLAAVKKAAAERRRPRRR